MMIATNRLNCIYLKDDYQLHGEDASGVLVFDLYDGGRIGISQTSEVEIHAIALDEIGESVELGVDEAIIALEQITTLLKEAQKNGYSLPTNRVIYQSPRTGRTIG